MKGLIFPKLRSYKGLIKVLFSFVKKAWAPCIGGTLKFPALESGYPLHEENSRKWQKKSLSRKTQGIWKFCQNTGKTQGIGFAQVVNSLIQKVKDISIFAVKNFDFFF